MVSTFSSNIQLEEPAFNDQAGTWDTPVDSNWTILDRVLGGITTISLNNANVTLTSSEFQSKTIIFNSTLTGAVTITFPTSFVKSYEIFNQCTGNFNITLATTAAGGQVICAPPNESHDMINDGTHIKFKSLHRIGRYWDYVGTSIPSWVTGCTIPPYLNCDGTTFSSATYPQLATIMGGNTLPDSRGRSRFALNQATGRITAGIGGVDGNTRYAAGGNQAMQSHNHAVSDPTHTHGHNLNINNNSALFQANPSGGSVVSNAAATISAALTGVSINNAGSGGSQNMPPAYVGGLTLIRAG